MIRALLLILLWTPSLFAASWEDTLFEKANQAYQAGDFPSAEKSYIDLALHGVDSPTLYYNLGNACFKQKKLGEAIYYWEKARRLSPYEQDILDNLQLANLMVVDRIESPPDPFPVRMLSRACNLAAGNVGITAGLTLFLAGNILFSIGLISRNPRLSRRAKTGSVVAAALFLLFAALFGWKTYRDYSTHEGIVIGQTAEIRSGPGVENVTVFTIHEGTKVKVQARTGEWIQISLPNGWNGWVPVNSVRTLQ